MLGAGFGQDNVTGDAYTLGVGIEPQLDELVSNLEFTSSLLDEVEDKFRAVSDAVSSTTDRVRELSRTSEDYAQIVDRITNQTTELLQSGQVVSGGGAQYSTAQAPVAAAGPPTMVAPSGVDGLMAALAQAQGGGMGGGQEPDEGEGETMAEGGGGDLLAKGFFWQSNLQFLGAQYRDLVSKMNRGGILGRMMSPVLQRLGNESLSLPGIRNTNAARAASRAAQETSQAGPQIAGMGDTEMGSMATAEKTAGGGAGIASMADSEMGGLTAASGPAAADLTATGASIGAGLLTVGAPLGALYLGYRGVTKALDLENQYAQVTGGQRDLGQAVGYEARIRMMALSPFLNEQQARQIVMTTLKGGYQGGEADTVMQFIANNVKTGVLSIGQSMDLYKSAIETAGASTDSLNNTLDHLRDTAATTQGSVSGITGIFQQQVQGAVQTGLMGAVPQIIGNYNSTIAQGSAYPALREYQGADLTNPAFQGWIASQLTYPNGKPVSIEQLPQFVQQQPYRFLQGQEEATRQLIEGMGYHAGMSSDAIMRDSVQLGNLGMQLATFGIISPDQAGNLSFLREFVQAHLGGPGGKQPTFSPKRFFDQSQHQASPATHLSASQADDLARSFAASNLRNMGLSPGAASQNHISAWYSGYIHRNQTTLPLLGSLIRNQTAGDTVVQPTIRGDDGRKLPTMSLQTYLEQYPGKASEEIRKGSLQMAVLTPDQREKYGLSGDIGGHSNLSALFNDPKAMGQLKFSSIRGQEGFGSQVMNGSAPTHVTIDLSPDASRYFRTHVSGSDYNPGAGQTRYNSQYGNDTPNRSSGGYTSGENLVQNHGD